MTVKEASEKFGIDDNEIRKRIKDEMIIGVRRGKRNCFDIPDETIFLPSKTEIRLFLINLLRIKNNSNTAISRSLCPNKHLLGIVLDYLYRRGFIGAYDDAGNDEKAILSSAVLTEEGFDFAFGQSIANNSRTFNINLSVPITNQFGLVNIKN